MTPEAQRIAIAEACGWNTERKQLGGVFVWHDEIGNMHVSLPDFLNDLNAMHEAEKVQLRSLDQWRRYSDLLKAAMEDAYYPIGAVDARYRSVNATAAQRAEAFLKTIGKWT